VYTKQYCCTCIILSFENVFVSFFFLFFFYHIPLFTILTTINVTNRQPWRLDYSAYKFVLYDRYVPIAFPKRINIGSTGTDLEDDDLFF
jgi:hypothetical protein